MGKLKWHIILALWLALCGHGGAEQMYVNESGWWRDGGAFNASRAPIQAAMDAAAGGDMIYVWNGSYTENVDVGKRLTLEGEGADVVTVTAADSGDHVFEVTADLVNISGLEVTGATSDWAAGIYLNNADRCKISENSASNNDYGIRLYSSSNNTLHNNNANSNSRGTYLNYSSDNALTSNTADNNWYGIWLYYSSNNNLTGNTANSNDGNGIYLFASSSNTLQDNTANSNNYHGIDLYHSSNNILHDNNANLNDWSGIALSGLSNSNTLQGNNASSNGNGITLSYSSNNTLQCNNASNNDRFGIRLDYSNSNNIVCNRVRNNNCYGICLSAVSGSTDNDISYNNIIENGNYNATSGGWEWQFCNGQSNSIDAKHNYWGAGMNNSTIDASIYDWGTGKVEFHPFETEQVPCAPTPEEAHTFTTIDAMIALRIAVGSCPPAPRWDVSGDGSVTSLDALMILHAAAGTINL